MRPSEPPASPTDHTRGLRSVRSAGPRVRPSILRPHRGAHSPPWRGLAPVDSERLPPSPSAGSAARRPSLDGACPSAASTAPGPCVPHRRHIPAIQRASSCGIHPNHTQRVTLRACGCKPRRSLWQPAPRLPVAGSLSGSTSRPKRVDRPLLGRRSANHNPNSDLVERNDREHTETVVGQVRQEQSRVHCCSRIPTGHFSRQPDQNDSQAHTLLKTAKGQAPQSDVTRDQDPSFFYGSRQ